MESTPSLKASDAVHYIASSMTTTGPLHAVWQTLIDTSSWSSWNSFCPRVTIREQPSDPSANPSTPSPVLQHGTKVTFHVRLNLNSTIEQDVHLVVTEFAPPDLTTSTATATDAGAMLKRGRIAWAADPSAAGTILPALLKAERVHELTETADGTEVRNWEIQTGMVAYMVRWMYGARLREVFEDWVQDLKGFVEK